MAESALEASSCVTDADRGPVNAFAATEALRQRTLRRYWLTVLFVICFALLALSPAVTIYAWLTGSLIAPSSGSLSRQLEATLTAHAYWVPLMSIAWLSVVVLASLLALRHFAWKPKASYLREATNLINDSLCDENFPGIRFEPDAQISKDRLNATALFASSARDYESQATFQGRWHAMRVCLCRFEASYGPNVGKGSHQRGAASERSPGIVFVAEYPGAMRSASRLLPLAEKFKSVRGEQKVELRDRTASRFFQARSNDPLRFAEQFDPSVLGILSAVANRYPDARIRCKDSELWITFAGTWDIPEPSLYRKIEANPEAPEFLRALGTCLQAADVIRKSTNLWV